MEAARQLYRDRIEAALLLLERVLTGALTSRPALVAELRAVYSERRIEPLRGFSKDGIYDKEVATVYLVGVHGAGVISPGNYDNIFHVENRAMDVIEALKTSEGPQSSGALDAVAKSTLEIKGRSVSDKVFRALRVIFTGTIFGYYDEQLLTRAIRAYESLYPELSERLLKYAAYYSAYKIAEAIAIGAIKSPEDLKIQKYAYCLKLGFQRCKPSDRLIAEVASSVYRVCESVLARLLARDVIPKLG
jgi:hypothetical protein